MTPGDGPAGVPGGGPVTPGGPGGVIGVPAAVDSESAGNGGVPGVAGPTRPSGVFGTQAVGLKRIVIDCQRGGKA